MFRSFGVFFIPNFFHCGFIFFYSNLLFHFFALVFKNEKFAEVSCAFLKEYLDSNTFNNLVGNAPFHVFTAKIGGASIKVLAKTAGGNFAFAAGGLLVADHAFHESGGKFLLENKVFLLNEQMKFDFAMKNNLPFVPAEPPVKTSSIFKNLTTINPPKL